MRTDTKTKPNLATFRARAAWAVLEADGDGVPARQPHRLGGRTHVLRRCSRSSRPCSSWCRSSGCSADSPTQAAARQRRRGRTGPAPRHLHRRDRRHRTGPGRRGRRCSRRAAPRCGRRRATSALHAGVQRDLRGRRRAARSGSCARCSSRSRSSWCCCSPSCIIAVVVTGPLAEAVGDALGLGGTAVTAWNIAKWPVLAAGRDA